MHDWAPTEAEGDEILYLFDVALLGDDEDRIKLQSSELDKWEWVSVAALGDCMIPRLRRRLIRAYEALAPILAIRRSTGLFTGETADCQNRDLPPLVSGWGVEVR